MVTGEHPLSQTEEELNDKLNDLEDHFSEYKIQEKSLKVNDIKHFIFENRKKLNFLDLNNQLEGRVKQLINQTEGYRSWFLSASQKEEILEKVKYLNSLKLTMLDARAKIKEELGKEADSELRKIISSFGFIDDHKEEEKKILATLIALAKDKKERYIKIIHFFMTHKHVLNERLLTQFVQLLQKRVEKFEAFLALRQLKNKDLKASRNDENEIILASTRFKGNLTFLKDLRDLILTELDRRVKAVAA